MTLVTSLPRVPKPREFLEILTRAQSPRSWAELQAAVKKAGSSARAVGAHVAAASGKQALPINCLAERGTLLAGEQQLSTKDPNNLTKRKADEMRRGRPASAPSCYAAGLLHCQSVPQHRHVDAVARLKQQQKRPLVFATLLDAALQPAPSCTVGISDSMCTSAAPA